MKKRYKIPGIVLAVLAVAVLSLALYVSHDSDCTPVAAIPENAERMKAVVYRCYGSPEVLSYEDVEKPTAADNQVLVKVHAASVNPLDWHYMRGSPYIMRLGAGIGAPDDVRMGVDYSGTVEAVGKDVTRFKPGDEVFGGRSGAFAEFVVVPENRAIALKPENVTFQQAASVGIAGVTALQALRDVGNVEAGQKVLINGASGGVGTFAVQIAKTLGAEVSGVCSTRNVEMVRSIGADHVIDYKKDDYTTGDEQYDVIVDLVGNHSLSKNRSVLSPEGTFVIVGGPKGDWLGPMMAPVKAWMMSPFVDQKMRMILAELHQEDLVILADMMEAGDVTPVIGRHYPLSEVAAAVGHSEEGHAQGKIIIDVYTDL